jgi:uncharacterized NAD(P)/FAD-binding protein YdhS
MRDHTIAIVGGGVSGTLTAYHLARQADGARIVIIDPRLRLGLGLAYSTPSLRHLLNVPAGKISALPDQPDHFLNWLRAHYDPAALETDFAPRAVFGQYIHSLLAAVPEVEHLQTTVMDCRIDGSRAILSLLDGSTLTADSVVLATGNFDPAPLKGVAFEALANGAYRHSAWEDTACSNLDPQAPVALIGTGLTGVDVVLRLRELGHRGIITAISRHGAFPNRHAAYQPLDQCVIAGPAPRKAVELLRAVHHALRSGLPWRAIIDSLRDRTNELWLALPLVEQRRFRRHLQRRWDIVRHRMAPSNADQIEAELAAGTLLVRQASLHSVLPEGSAARVQFRLPSGAIEEVAAARVINCTGPNMNYRRVDSPLLLNLFERGAITAGPLGGGLWSNADGALRAADGTFSSILFLVGPGRLGTLFESIAVPELRMQAVALADHLADRLATSRSRTPHLVKGTSGVLRESAGLRQWTGEKVECGA